MKLTIRRTEINGRFHRARGGPLTITKGAREHPRLVFDIVEETSANGERSLRSTQTHLSGSTNKWRVDQPAWVRTSGLGVSKSKVVSGLKHGIASNVTRHLTEQGPKLFRAIMHQIATIEDSNTVVSSPN